MNENELWPIASPLGPDGNEYSPTSHPGAALSFLDLVILNLLESSPMTGYVIRKRLIAQFRLRVSFGTLYPRLKAFERDGIVQGSEVTGEFAARNTGTNYELTSAGKTILQDGLRKFEGSLRKIRSEEPTRLARF